MIDAGAAMILVGVALQAAEPIAAIAARARRRRETTEAIRSLPSTPTPRRTPPDMLELLARLG